jgi:wyosine [tRNA(Phe)-imidazoG37] synthetase (radical SAM superfamily)
VSGAEVTTVQAPDRRFDPAITGRGRPRVALAFGPIPSRRLGRSLGINNIPPKICSYGCVYCQVGATPSPQLEPRPIYPPEELARAVARHVERVREPIDYLTFVPDGEPTLDANLGRAIELLRPLEIPIAVISNGSLAWRQEVREALRAADWVSVKVDAADEATWRRVNRPPDVLTLATVLQGIRALTDGFPGRVVAETMLVEGMNDDIGSVTAVADFLRDAGIRTAYVSIPTRPPAEPRVHGPDEAVVARAHEILAERLPQVEYLIGYEGEAFAASGDPRADLLSISAVHPLRESAVRDLLRRSGSEWSVVQRLVDEGLLRSVEHEGLRFYVRRFHRPRWAGVDRATLLWGPATGGGREDRDLERKLDQDALGARPAAAPPPRSRPALSAGVEDRRRGLPGV